MDHQFYAVLLLLVGFMLIVAEVFLPSGGIIFLLCALSFLGSVWFATQAWYGTHPWVFGIYVTSLVVLIPTVIIGAFQAFPRTSFGKNLIGAPTLEEVTPHAQETERLRQYIGRVGRAITPLTPGGLVLMNSERLHAFSEGVLIERDTPVEILEVRGTRVLVREATVPEEGMGRSIAGEASAAPPGVDIAFDDSSSEPPLDFNIPQG